MMVLNKAASWKILKDWKECFRTTCLSVLLYGCETWITTKRHGCETKCFCYLMLYDHFEHQTARQSLKCRHNPPPPPTRRINDLTGTIPLLSTVISRQLKFLGHILRMENDETANIYALFEPLTGEYPRGDGINPFPAKSRNGSTSIVRGWRRTHCSRPSQLEANCSFSF